MCGEEAVTLLYAMADEGSPPHVRGRVTNRQSIVSAGGITPACAGKSLNSIQYEEETGDHPRMCGEETKRIPIISHSV